MINDKLKSISTLFIISEIVNTGIGILKYTKTGVIIVNMKDTTVHFFLQVTASETTGSGSDQAYTTKLWYFDLLTFLDEKANVTGGTETLEDESAHDTEETVSNFLLFLLQNSNHVFLEGHTPLITEVVREDLTHFLSFFIPIPGVRLRK